jgi:flagellar basal-body rod protein FlgC
MYGSLDIAVSGMIAQRTRLDVITANVVNKDAVLDSREQVNPFQRRITYFAPGDPTAKTAEGRRMGVHVADIGVDTTPAPLLKFEPESPLAYKDGPNKGWVPGTNINGVVEQIDALEAGRAYEACATAAETTKNMMAQGLRLIA